MYPQFIQPISISHVLQRKVFFSVKLTSSRAFPQSPFQYLAICPASLCGYTVFQWPVQTTLLALRWRSSCSQQHACTSKRRTLNLPLKWVAQSEEWFEAEFGSMESKQNNVLDCLSGPSKARNPWGAAEGDLHGNLTQMAPPFESWELHTNIIYLQCWNFPQRHKAAVLTVSMGRDTAIWCKVFRLSFALAVCIIVSLFFRGMRTPGYVTDLGWCKEFTVLLEKNADRIPLLAEPH